MNVTLRLGLVLSLTVGQTAPAAAQVVGAARSVAPVVPVAGVGAAGAGSRSVLPSASLAPALSAPVLPGAVAPSTLRPAPASVSAPAAVSAVAAPQASPAAAVAAAQPLRSVMNAVAAEQGRPKQDKPVAAAAQLEAIAGRSAKSGKAGVAGSFDGTAKADPAAAAANLVELKADIAQRTGLVRPSANAAAPRIAVVAAARLPQGKFPNSYSKRDSAKDLGAKLVGGLLDSAGMTPESLKNLSESGNEVKFLFGAVDNSESPDIGREIAVKLGLTHIPGTGIAKNCGTSLEAVGLAIGQLISGQADIVVAGGAESMSRLPMITKDPVLKQQFMTLAVLPSMIASASLMQKPMMMFAYAQTWLAHKWHLMTTHHRFAITEGLPIDGDVMAATAQRLADKYGVSRTDMDWFAYNSQNRAEKATREGAFADEIVSYDSGKGVETVDQGIRFGQSRKGFGSRKIKPVFGTEDITAANASQISDGAAGVILMLEDKARELGLVPLAFVSAVADTAGDPREMGIQPAYALPKALKKAGVALEDLQVVELNEAFAAQAISVMKALGLPAEKVNPRGGAIALGHPLAASGARILTTLIHTMMHKGLHKGACSLCIGGGEGIAAVVERDENGIPEEYIAALKGKMAARGVSAPVVEDVERALRGLPPMPDTETGHHAELERFFSFLDQFQPLPRFTGAERKASPVLARRVDARIARVQADLAAFDDAEKIRNLIVSVSEGVATVAIDRGPVNAINADLVEEFGAVFHDLSKRSDVKAIVLTGKGKTFVAGADITLIQSAANPAEAAAKAAGLQRLLDKVEGSEKPILVALNGQTLGGGSELAISAHERWAAGTAELAQPEIKLLFNPGAGGTQRLVRLVGLTEALTAMNSGQSSDAHTAKEKGWVDEVVAPAELLTRVQARARELAALPDAERAAWVKAHRTLDKPVKLTLMERIGMLWGGFLIKRAVADQTRALGKDKEIAIPAMMGIIDATLTGINDGPRAGLAKEAEVFGRLAASPASKFVQRLFLRSTGGPKLEGITDGTVEPLAINKVAVVGAGAMGAGIAQLAAYADVPVVVKEVAQGPLEAGLAKIKGLFQGLVEKLVYTPEKAAAKFANVIGLTDDAAFNASEPDLLIEAVKEDLGLKKKLFALWGKNLPERTILATNTSALSITTLALASGRPGKVVGLHYFNPPHKLPLVELILPDKEKLSAAERAELDRTVASVIPYLKKTGRMVVVTQDAPGFIVNRILFPYVNTALRLVEEGAGVAQVDAAMRKLGAPMGPLQLADHIGFFLGIEVGEYLKASFPHVGSASLMLQVLKSWGHEGSYWGAKKGFYVDGKPVEALVRQAAAVARAVEAAEPATPEDRARLIAEFSAKKEQLAAAAQRGLRTPSGKEIEDRLVRAMYDEGRVIVDTGVVSSEDEIDIAMTTGMGFPVQTGGLMRYGARGGAK
ncbi:MAG: acetyl-CoA C-acyltransferase [Elusimicrobia bacterium]|nr:acetyl-CoA C-acyltransferase [Elusimicrobiota bacterium]